MRNSYTSIEFLSLHAFLHPPPTAPVFTPPNSWPLLYYFYIPIHMCTHIYASRYTHPLSSFSIASMRRYPGLIAGLHILSRSSSPEESDSLSAVLVHHSSSSRSGTVGNVLCPHWHVGRCSLMSVSFRLSLLRLHGIVFLVMPREHYLVTRATDSYNLSSPFMIFLEPWV